MIAGKLFYEFYPDVCTWRICFALPLTKNIECLFKHCHDLSDREYEGNSMIQRNFMFQHCKIYWFRKENIKIII